jgi:hypothetical protein
MILKYIVFQKMLIVIFAVCCGMGWASPSAAAAAAGGSNCSLSGRIDFMELHTSVKYVFM